MRKKVRERLQWQKEMLAEAGVGRGLPVGVLFAIFLLAAVFLMSGSNMPVLAAQEAAAPEAAVTEAAAPEEAVTETAVIDYAGLFSADECAELYVGIRLLEEASDWDIYAVTTADAMGKTATAYADDFFDTYAEKEDGVVLLIDMDNREIAISTCGEAIRYLTDARIDAILEEAYTDISNGYYGDCMQTMLDGVQKYYDAGIESNQYNYDVETGKKSVYRSIEPLEAAFAIAAALACGILLYAGVNGKYRVHYGAYQYAFRENGNVVLRKKDDRFVHQTLTHRKIQTQTTGSGGSSGSSGRSSVHTSSSGHSHGGGSKKF